jgi:hypothetical protein
MFTHHLANRTHPMLSCTGTRLTRLICSSTSRPVPYILCFSSSTCFIGNLVITPAATPRCYVSGRCDHTFTSSGTSVEHTHTSLEFMQHIQSNAISMFRRYASCPLQRNHFPYFRCDPGHPALSKIVNVFS